MKPVFAYYGTPERLSQQEAYHCTRYLRRNRERIVVTGSLLVDTDALMRPFHLDCRNCRAVHGTTCCEGGHPYAVADWQIALLDEALPDIVREFLPANAREAVEKTGVWQKDGEPGTLAHPGQDCAYFCDIGKKRGCAIHAWALRHGREVGDWKPFSCQLYPLELIRIGEQVLVTALTEETAAFSRWGTGYLGQFLCADLARRKAERGLPDEWFALDGYRPAYVWGRGLFSRTFGAEAAAIWETVMKQKTVCTDER